MVESESGNTGNNGFQLATQQCCATSCAKMLPVLLDLKQKLQMMTFSELVECLARIPPKITLYGLLFKYNYVGCLLILMFSIDLLFAVKRDAYLFKETG